MEPMQQTMRCSLERAIGGTMARPLNPMLFLAIASLAAGAAASEPAPPGGDSGAAAPGYAIPRTPSAAATERRDGTRIFAGTALLPNTVFGLGLFGERARKEPLAPVTAREISLPKQRKAAVGFSLRF